MSCLGDNPCSQIVKQIYNSRHHLTKKMKCGIVSTFEGAKIHPGAMWIHQLLILQAVMREAEITCDMDLNEEMTLLDGNDWDSHINTVEAMFYGTCLWWTSKEMTWEG